MPFDINSVKGVQGVSVGTRALTLPTPGIFGFSVGSRETLDLPGVYGFSVVTPATAVLNVQPTNFVVISQPLTIAISWAGHNAETYAYDATTFVTSRDLPLNTLITFQTSGAAYATTITTATLTSNLPTALNVLVALSSNLNAYRRRRYL